jgi:DNA-binding MarR family transcriptional regulator
VAAQSGAAVEQAARILDLHDVYRQRLQAARATGPTLATLDRLFENPYVTVRRIAEATQTSPPTATGIVKRLLDAGIVEETTGQKRGRVYCATELLRTLEESPA